VDCHSNLNLLRLRQKRPQARFGQPLGARKNPNQGKSGDFLSDALCVVRKFTDFNRESLRIEIDTDFPAAPVIWVLNKLVEVQCAPLSTQMDNGPDFSA